MRGYDYQFRVQADGLNFARTAWVPAPSDGVVLVAKELVLTPTRTVAGRVVDRSGRAIAGAEVIQAGDGPERTATVSDAEGRFRLGGYGEGPALVAARADGYRWGGSLVADGETVVALTRLDEAPARAMPSLPPAPADDLLAMSRRLLAPVLDEAMKGEDAAQKRRALLVLAEIAPREARDLAIEAGLATDVSMGRILAPSLARLDVAAALKLVEGQPDAGARARMLVEVVDALPPGPDPRKVSLLVRATVAAGDAANADDRAMNFSAVAERFAELGEMGKALPLYAKAREEAAALGAAVPARAIAAARLARVDPAAAIPLIRAIPDPRQRSIAIMNLAARVASARPHDFDAVIDSFDRNDWSWSEFLACDRMAPVDRAHAERIADGMDTPFHRGLAFLCLAHGLAKTEPEAAERAFHRALAEIEADPDAVRAVALDPLTMTRTVEEIDPALVPEFLWFAASRRRPLPPSLTDVVARRRLDQWAAIVSRHDSALAASLFAGELARLRTLPPEEFARIFPDAMQAVAQIDPTTAVVLVESIPRTGDTNRDRAGESLRIQLAEFLARWATHPPPPQLPNFSGLTEVLNARDPG